MATLKVLPVSLLFSLAVFSSQRSLYPLYGSVPTDLYSLPIICASTALGTLVPINSLSTAWSIASVWLVLSPRIALHVGATTSAKLNDPILGPVITNVVLLAPLLFASSIVLRRFTRFGLERLSALTTHTLVILSASRLWAKNNTLSLIDDDKILSALGVIALVCWVFVTPLTRTVRPSDPKKGDGSKNPSTGRSVQSVDYAKVFTFVILATLPALSYVFPATLHPLRRPFTHPTAPVRILSSVQSITGVIVVGETLPLDKSDPRWSETHNTIQDMRFLRASHSLLGGVWIGGRTASIDDTTPVAIDSHGTRLGDSVYSTFVLQEAVLLLKNRSFKNALTIGLGAGISTQAFQQHGLNTTIVEIDPAVYKAAREYFGLGDPGSDRVFLEDARGWAARRRASLSSASATSAQEKFDIVVHDCFSGGGVPQHIFTAEFWNDLQASMSPDGVLVVNFAGPPASDSARAILTTLESAYGQCRAFHDHPSELTEEEYRTEFINIVFFCTSSSEPIDFRMPKNEDYLNSHLRRYVFMSVPKREISRDVIHQGTASISMEERAKWILTDARNPLGAWQDEGAMEHWKVMNSVFPSKLWEIY